MSHSEQRNPLEGNGQGDAGCPPILGTDLSALQERCRALAKKIAHQDETVRSLYIRVTEQTTQNAKPVFSEDEIPDRTG